MQINALVVKLSFDPFDIGFLHTGLAAYISTCTNCLLSKYRCAGFLCPQNNRRYIALLLTVRTHVCTSVRLYVCICFMYWLKTDKKHFVILLECRSNLLYKSAVFKLILIICFRSTRKYLMNIRNGSYVFSCKFIYK